MWDVSISPQSCHCLGYPTYAEVCGTHASKFPLIWAQNTLTISAQTNYFSHRVGSFKRIIIVEIKITCRQHQLSMYTFANTCLPTQSWRIRDGLIYRTCWLSTLNNKRRFSYNVQKRHTASISPHSSAYSETMNFH